MEEEKISPFQATALIAGSFLGSSIVMNPAAAAGADAWFSSLTAVVTGLVIVSMTAALAAIHPGKSLVEILIACFGRTAGRIIGFGYLLFSIWLSSAVVLTFSYYNVTISYPETPTLYISICYMLVIAFAVKIGLEVMGRISEVLIIFVVIITIVTFFSLMANFHPDAFLPMFKDGLAKPVTAGLKDSTPFAEIFLALNILPNLNDQKKTFRVTRNAVLLAGGIMFLFTIRNISVLGVDVAARDVYPSEKVFRLMPGLDIIPLLDINVIITGIIKVSVALYASAKILGDLFGLKEFKMFVLPLAALVTAVSVFVAGDFFSQSFVVINILSIAYLPILIILPMILLIVSLKK
ncbi:MAG: endospore germination permease [Clostridia bacterium]|nr:endospore germination permease [Clostridia bacterium]